jgi:hypothetical protein
MGKGEGERGIFGDRYMREGGRVGHRVRKVVGSWEREWIAT